MTLEVMDIEVLNHNIRSQARFSLRINGFLHYFFKSYGFLVLLLYFYFNKKFKPFSKIADQSELIKSPNRVKFCQNRLEILNMQCLILGIFQLILEIPPKLILETINKGLKAFKVLIEESFKFRPYNRDSTLLAILMLSLNEAYKAIKKYGCKRDTVYPYGV